MFVDENRGYVTCGPVMASIIEVIDDIADAVDNTIKNGKKSVITIISSILSTLS